MKRILVALLATASLTRVDRLFANVRFSMMTGSAGSNPVI